MSTDNTKQEKPKLSAAEIAAIKDDKGKIVKSNSIVRK